MAEDDTRYVELLALAQADLGRLVRRCRALSPHAWRSRREAVVSAIARLAELDVLAEAVTARELPELADFALGDAAAVVGGDVLVALANEPRMDLLTAMMTALDEALDATR